MCAAEEENKQHGHTLGSAASKGGPSVEALAMAGGRRCMPAGAFCSEPDHVEDDDAATPPGLEVTVRVRLEEVDGRRLTFSAQADDGPDRICAGRHQRFVVDRARFEAGVARKAAGG